MITSKATLINAAGNALADFLINDEQEGWYSGDVASDRLPADLKKALSWYDEIVQNQMLSYLDRAVADVDQFRLKIKFGDGSVHPVHRLHISGNEEVSFRITPIPPRS